MKDKPTFTQVRKIKPTRLSVSGFLPFRDGTSIPYESTLERDFLIYHTYDPHVVEIVAQPMTIPFVKYHLNYKYTPDFFVRFNDGRKPILVEVKPKAKWQEHWREWREKWKAAMHYCKENDFVVHVYDEAKIRHIALANINAVQRYKRLNCDVEDINAVLNHVKLMGTVTIDYLLARFFSGSLYRQRGLQVIYHLLAEKHLHCDWFMPLNEFTEVWGNFDE